MKTMKYFLSMAALAMVGAMTVSCSSDDNIIEQPQQPETKNNVVTLTTTVGFDEAAGTTRALAIDYTAETLTKTFKESEQIALIYTQTGGTTAKAVSAALTDGDISADGKLATFTFELTEPDKTKSVTYIYPAVMAGSDGADWSKLDTQDGTLASIASTLDYASADAAWNGDALPTVTLDNMLAIIAYTLKDATGETDITNTITGMTISQGTSTYTITGKDTDGHIYAAIRPTSEANIEYTATDGTKNYTKSVTGKSYNQGGFYQVGLRMAEPAPAYPLLSAATTSDYGKVVCAAGHLHEAKTAVPSGCTAVGILGKVTGTGQGLILALEDATPQYWTTINGWTSVTTYASTTLKQLPDDAARGTNLTSYTKLGATTVSNWAVAQKSDYEAIFINLGSTTRPNSYGTTYDAKVNDHITTGVGGTAISGDYWSATESNTNWAWMFNSNYFGKSSGTSWSFSVRPVLGF